MNGSSWRLGGCVAVLALTGAGCLDLLGHEEVVTQSTSLQGTPRLEDDKIEDKKPAFDASRTVVESFGPQYAGCEITVNKSAAVTKLDVLPFGAAAVALDGKLFRGRTEALAAVGAVSGTDAIPSMEVINGALKPFNDGLYAALELQMEQQKRNLLIELSSALQGLLPTVDATVRPAFEDASVLLGAALLMGGDTPGLDGNLLARAVGEVGTFTAQPFYSRPIGFYTWTQPLERIFTRDRYLQNGQNAQPFGAFAALALILRQTPSLLDAYNRVTAFYAGLSDPYTTSTLAALVPYVPDLQALTNVTGIAASFQQDHPPRDACQVTSVAFLPASRNKEADYFDAKFCGAGVPPGTNLLDVLITAVQDGAVDLAPGADAGWYDYQEAALETLLVPERAPESQHLLLTVGYKEKLVDTFKSILIQTRETHVKQLEVAGNRAAGAIPSVDLYPLLPVEPFPTFYLRTARAYRFLRAFLQGTVGAGVLENTQRVVEDGTPPPQSLADELDRHVGRLYGLALLAADATGLGHEELGLLADELTEIDLDVAAPAARNWLETWKTDADVVRDPRVIVPIYGNEDGSAHYWAVVGVKAIAARAEFVTGHEPVVTPTACWTGKLVPHTYTLLVEESAEIDLPKGRAPPTRDELRAVCDAHATTIDIVHALESM